MSRRYCYSSANSCSLVAPEVHDSGPTEEEQREDACAAVAEYLRLHCGDAQASGDDGKLHSLSND